MDKSSVDIRVSKGQAADSLFPDIQASLATDVSYHFSRMRSLDAYDGKTTPTGASRVQRSLANVLADL